MVINGSIISSIEYNKEKDGTATNTRIIAGINVQTISNQGACVTIIGSLMVSLLNNTIVRPNIYTTNPQIDIKKKKRSW